MKKPRHQKGYYRLRRANYSIAAAGAFLIAVFFSVYLAAGYRSHSARESENLRIITSTAASKTQNMLNTLLITMSILDEWMQNNPYEDPRLSPSFNRLVETFRTVSHRSIELRMVTSDGDLYDLPSREPSPLAYVGDREYFEVQQLKPAGNFFFGNPVKSRVTGYWGIPVSFKLHDNRQGLMIIFAIIEFRAFDAQFSDIPVYPEQAVNVIREDRTILQRTPYDENSVGERFPHELEDSGTGIINTPNPEGTKRVFCYQKLEDLPVYVLVSDSYARILDAWLHSAIRELIVATAILAGYLYLNVRLARLLRKNDEMQKRLEITARVDSLTGMKNRSCFFERFAEETERSKRTGDSLVLLVADIDFFKRVNDTWGHPEGDRILIEVSQAIEKSIRAMDIAGRVGGEEFAILLTGLTLGAAKDAAERIRAAAAKVTFKDWPGGLSVGVAEWKGPEESIGDLYTRADKALYIAKDTGRNRVVVLEA